ncbi:MAG TPA: hypothetical protein VEG64_05770 [Candidatus Sulfotelmatobacter sp.]|nr:hypothetical protein [Candidatus Sulfotelmatobacter sp.]
MSISSVSGTSLFSAINEIQTQQNGQSKFQQIQSEFQQLGNDLQAGNLTQAQQDFATLSQNFPVAQSQSQAQTNNSNPIANAFNALSQDLQNGNLSAAQQDFANLQQAAQQQQGGGQVHHHHHHHGGGGGGQQNSQIAQAFQSLGQALQSGDLSGAQSAFATIQQDLQQFSSFGSTAQAGGTSSTASQTTGTNLNVTA